MSRFEIEYRRIRRAVGRFILAVIDRLVLPLSKPVFRQIPNFTRDLKSMLGAKVVSTPMDSDVLHDAIVSLQLSDRRHHQI